MTELNINKPPINSKKDSPLWQTAILSSTHLLNDFYTGILAPILPILILNFGLSKFQAGLLSAFLQWPSVTQPFFGRLADKTNLQKYIFFFPLITGIFMSLIGIAPGPEVLSISLLLAGLSSACFHAVAPPIAGKVSAEHSGKGLSLWMIGGETGWMLSPLLIVSFINIFSLKAMPYLIIPAAIASFILYFRLNTIDAVRNHVKVNQGSVKSSLKNITPMLIPIILVAASRSLLQSTTNLYVPTYLTENGTNLWLAGAALTLVMGGGVFGTIIGGIYKDKIGGKPVLFTSLLGSAVFLFAFIYTQNFLQIASLFFSGFFSGMYLPTALSMIQEYSSQDRSFANGTSLAILFTMGAISNILLGFLYDQFGGKPAFILSGIISLVGLLFIFLIPSEKSSTKNGMQEDYR